MAPRTVKLPQHAPIPASLVKDKLVSPAGKVLWAALWLYGDGVTRGCFPATPTLADDIGWNKRKVIRAIAHLEERGWLRVTRKKGDVSQYVPLLERERPAIGDTTDTSTRRGSGDGGDTGVTTTGDITRHRSAGLPEDVPTPEPVTPLSPELEESDSDRGLVQVSAALDTVSLGLSRAVARDQNPKAKPAANGRPHTDHMSRAVDLVLETFPGSEVVERGA